MSNIIAIWVWILILPSILLILMPLIDDILTDNVINNINWIVWNVDAIIGSTGTNILFATIWLIIVMPAIRRILSFFNTDSKQ